jgi:hypothetical protein
MFYIWMTFIYKVYLFNIGRARNFTYIIKVDYIQMRIFHISL